MTSSCEWFLLSNRLKQFHPSCLLHATLLVDHFIFARRPSHRAAQQHVCSIKGNDAVHLQLLVWCWRGFAVAACCHGNRSTEETVIFQQAGCYGKPTMVRMGGRWRDRDNKHWEETVIFRAARKILSLQQNVLIRFILVQQCYNKLKCTEAYYCIIRQKREKTWKDKNKKWLNLTFDLFIRNESKFILLKKSEFWLCIA